MGALPLPIINSLTWPSQVLPFLPDTGAHCSLAIDRDRNALITCWRDAETASGQLLFIRGRKEWVSEPVAEGRGFGSSLAIDASGKPWIAYHHLDTAALIAARKEGAIWIRESVTEMKLSNFAVARASLALAPDGLPGITYSDGRGLSLATRSSTGQWRSEPVDHSSSAVGLHNSLGFDSQGVPHIIYFDDDQRTLKYARGSGANRVIQIIQTPAESFAGEFLALKIDSAGIAHAAFWTLAGPHYVRLEGPSPAPESIDTAEGVGLYIALALDNQGQPRVTYYDPVNGRLKYAARKEHWTPEVVDETGDSGGYTALAIDPIGTSLIAYYDWEARRLRFAESNRPPRLTDDHFSTFVNRKVTGNVLVNDSDPDEEPLIATTTPLAAPQHGSLTIDAQGNITYIPNEGFNGTDSFRYQACDPRGLCEGANATIEVSVPVLATSREVKFLEPGQGAIRASTVVLKVKSSVPNRIEVMLEKKNGDTFTDTAVHDNLSNFTLGVGANQSGTGPFRFSFRVPKPSGTYELARSVEFNFPQFGFDTFIEGSLEDSEGPLQT